MDLQALVTNFLPREQKLRLVPFFSTLIMYILYMPVWGYPPETLKAVFFKILPVASLGYYVIISAKKTPGLSVPTKDDLLPDDDRARHFLFGLGFSALGDAFLVWREGMFIPGLLSFAIGHVFYLIGLGEEPKQSRTKELFTLAGIDVFLFLRPGINSYVLVPLVALYCALIFSVGWRATARYETEGNKAAFCGSMGALLFIASDFIIALDKWIFPVPFAPSLIMSTYYAGQLGLALSTSKELADVPMNKPKTSSTTD